MRLHIFVPGDRPTLARRAPLHLRDATGRTQLFAADALYLPVHFVASPSQAGARCYLIEPLDAAERHLS